MNLADITTKCYILALIIRDDGERLLLGDGAYEFKDSQQHFIANTYANDVVELQGTDGQMLAGQVRRTATQTFAGYIGDATFSKQAVESARRDFLMFFRKKHYYTAVYVFSDGTAIQRDRGYIVNAPSVPELYQRYPEWSVGLNFEDPNYYEYAEDDLGQEIAAHKVELELSTAMSGGLIWDGDGAVSDDLSYVGTEIQGEGKNFQLVNTGTATLKSAELLGDAEQDGTPTPDAPVAVNTVTGEQTVKIEGKNLCSSTSVPVATQIYFNFNKGSLVAGTYTLSATLNEATQNNSVYLVLDGAGVYIGATMSGSANQKNVCHFTLTQANIEAINNSSQALLRLYKAGASFVNPTDAQLELGSTATTYEPYQGQVKTVNLGKNLFDLKGFLESKSVTYTEASDGTITFANVGALYSDPFQFSQEDITVSVQGIISNLTGSNFRLQLINKAGTSVGEINSSTITRENLSACKVRFNWSSSGTFSLKNVQVERGTQPTSYSAYFTPIELAGVGEIQSDGLPEYRDSLKKNLTTGKWYIEKQVGKVVLDGTNADITWSLTAQSGAYNFWYRNNAMGALDERHEKLCDNFTYSPLEFNNGAPTPSLCENQYNSVVLTIFKTDGTQGTTVADWKTWLSTHPTTVYYALATPTTTEITNSELIGQLERLRHAHTYADTTNFSITATSPNLPAFLKVVAFGDDAIPQGGYVWEDGGTGGATTITVDGVDNAQPIWTVVGPATNPSLTNITTGESIQWTGVVPNGQTLVVNMADMTASLSGANVFEFISGSWITLQAGNNRVSYSATAATGIATLEWNGVVG